jgi:F420-dependent oxidoreductase-like protein
MRIATGLAGNHPGDWEGAATFAAEAERLGVASVSSAEAWGRDAITPLAFVAARTTSIRLMTGIMQVGARTPAMVAMTAAGMQSVSGGRFILGLGTSGPQVIEGWHGVPFDRPIQRTRELIEMVRLAGSGERLEYHGQVTELPLPGGQGRAIRSAAGEFTVPIYLAALGPKNLELTGELCDGWIGTSFIPETADVFFDRIRVGAERAGRTLDDIDLQVPVTVEFGDDVDEIAKRHARGYAFTFGAMGSRTDNFYLNAFARQGYADEGREIQRLWLDGKREEAADRVPVELAHRTNLLGTDDLILERLRVYRDAGVNTLRAGVRGESVAERITNLGRLIDLVAAVDAEVAG